ncbi:hypothetical protein [Nannocystis sp.]|uniref:hypothetical protein n=1 Tax=Nannocystis sp. TaxID=1962667 RepID=UPI0025D5E02E|nr:hypothetical protein [Nannocystis sp.]MBK7825359.1 hypothetical protein [Nannocystis sp.]
MGEQFSEAIVEQAGKAGERGVAMGQIVDAMVGLGHGVEAVEQAIWELMASRRLTPSGFVCRIVKRRDAFGEPVQARSYELLLVPWSAEQDRQLELGLPRG